MSGDGAARGVAAVVGLGAIGAGVAASLLRAGFAVRGADPRAEALADLAARGGVACAGAAEAAEGAGAVFLCVVSAAQAEDALFGPGGAARSLSPGAVVLGCATVAPSDAERLAARLAAETGAPMLDAPTSGGAARAAAGEMTVMASGPPEAFARAGPYLAATASKVYRLGDAPGLGSRAKAVNQLLAGVHIAAAAEAVALAARLGLDPRLAYEVVSESAGSSWMFRDRAPRMMEDDPPVRSAVDIFVKDLGIALDAARAAGLGEMPVAEAARARFLAARDAGLGRADDSALVRLYPGGGRLAPGTGGG